MGNRWVVLIKANSSTWTKFPQTINLQIFGLFSRYKMCGGGQKMNICKLKSIKSTYIIDAMSMWCKSVWDCIN